MKTKPSLLENGLICTGTKLYTPKSFAFISYET